MTKLELPECLTRALTKIFPTVDLGRIDFYLDDSLEYPDHPGSFRAGFVRSVIRIHPKQYGPCSAAAFQSLIHELVHALQSQSSGRWWHRVASMTCQIFHGREGSAYAGSDPSCLENEAWRFASIDWGRVPDDSLPCKCIDAPGVWETATIVPVRNLKFDEFFDRSVLVEKLPLVKKEAGCSPFECLRDGFFNQISGFGVIAASAYVAALGTFFYESALAAVGTVVGATIGVVAVVGLAVAVGLGIVVIIPLVIVAVLVGALIGGFVGALVGWVAGLFGGGTSGGSINLMFSTDRGRSFGNKATFERTRQQPALAFRSNPDQLFVGWTGTDSHLSVFVAPNRSKVTLDRSDPSGPALATGDGKVFLAWKGTDDHPNCLFSFDANGFGGKFISGGDGPRESNMGVAFGRGMVYVAWVGADNHIRLINLRPTDPLMEVPNPAHQLGARTGHLGTPALAFGAGRLFLAWSRFEPSHLIQLLEVPVAGDGVIVPFNEHQRTITTTDFTNDTTGPALAYSERDGRLYLAFTGADDRLYVISSTDAGRTFPDRLRLDNELSRHDTGPGLAVHPAGTLCLSWVGIDGD
jgi:hypothetical protein